MFQVRGLAYGGMIVGLAVIVASGGALPAASPDGLAERFSSVVASPNGSAYVQVRRTDATTEILTGPAPEGLRRLAVVDGDWTIRTVAFDGSQVALGVPLDGDESMYEPHGRSMTEVAIVDLRTGDTRRMSQTGNVEPEAFSTDGKGMYVIDHRPALQPEYYRVAYVDLRTGERADVYGPDKKPLDEDMQGTGRDQVYAPSGRFLYTVYTRQNVSGHGDHPHVAGFVHVLSLAEQFAICVDLPEGFGQGSDASISVNDDGSEVYVVDPTAGRVAVLTVGDDGFLYAVSSIALAR